MVTLHEVITFLVSMQISISSLQTHNVNRCGRRDRKSGSAGMPRPISYAVFCLKKKKRYKHSMKDTTIKIDGDLLRELERTKPPTHSLPPHVRSLLHHAD